MSGFVNNYYYGKAGKADYTPDQLPSTRIQLFFEMLRIHFSGMVGINLFYFLFCLPAALVTLATFSIMTTSPETMEAAETLSFLTNSLVPTYLLLMIPCLAIAGIGAPGLMYVLRNWARDQHAFTFSDFKDNVKANWKNGVLVGFINGFALCASYIGYTFYGRQSAQYPFLVIPQMLVIMICIFWWMINMIIYPMMVTYDMKFSQLVRNCAIIILARIPWALLIFLGSLVIPVACLFFIPSAIAYLIAGLFYLLIGFSLTGLVYASFANACFDRFLNPKIEGAPVNMGLRDPSEDDDDDDDTTSQSTPN